QRTPCEPDSFRLRPIFERLKRAGVKNVQVLPPGEPEGLAKLAGKMDLVLIDAACSGSGVWRRPPGGARSAGPEGGGSLVKPGGCLAYITCSVLPSENRDQVDNFLAGQPQ